MSYRMANVNVIIKNLFLSPPLSLTMSTNKQNHPNQIHNNYMEFIEMPNVQDFCHIGPNVSEL